MRRPFLLLYCLLVMMTMASLRADVIHVPGDQPTIQRGIDSADDGDSVMIAQGIYYESNLNFKGKAITVMSTDPDDYNTVSSTVIHAGFKERVFNFHSDEDSSSVLTGLTLTGGYTSGWGGAIHCDDSSPMIAHNIIKDNSADYGGGGIFLQSSNAIIRGNTITGNVADWGGGGIRCSDTDARIENNTISGNISEYGGGIDCHYDSDPTISNNIIRYNSSVDGGGVYCYEFSSPTLVNNLFEGNTADYGGGMHCRYDSSPTLISNTFTNNSAGIHGGSVRCRFASSPTVVNSIFWGNSAPQGKEFYMGDPLTPNPSILTISYSVIEGGMASIFFEKGNDPVWGNGMLASDPFFVLQDKSDYRLLWESPCIDAGHPDSLDLDQTRSDIGSFSFDQNEHPTLYLTPDTYSVLRGDELGVNYTIINRMDHPESFLLYTEVILPNGNPYSLFGPNSYNIPQEYTIQVHISHYIPDFVPSGEYTYRSVTETLLNLVPGEDSFPFWVIKE